MVVIDSSVWVDYLRGTDTLNTIWLDQNVSLQRVGLVDLVLTEVLQGVCPPKRFSEVRADLGQYTIFQTGGDSLAIASAQNYCLLRARGITIRKIIDCLIATFCIAEGHILLHNDRDFDPFEQHLGLQVLHPSSH